MAKDAYYFSHDSNAKDDPKCVMLIEQLGLEGYGIYWVLVEMLRDQPGYKYPLSLIPAISRRYNTTFEKAKTVIYNYGLFEIDENDFFSLSLLERMEHLDSKRKQASMAGKRSAEVRMLNASSTDVQRTFNASSTIKVNETKVNETKVNEINDKKISFAENVKMKKEEHLKLCEEFGKDMIDGKIEDLNNWKGGKGKVTKDDYLTIRAWIRKDTKDTQRGEKPNRPKSFDAIDEWARRTEGMIE